MTMLLQPADDRDFPPFDSGSDRARDDGAGPLPVLTPAILHEAFVMRGRYGAAAEAEVDRRIALAMEGSRLEEVNHLWAVWLALKDHG
jgi:hypothetical protein